MNLPEVISRTVLDALKEELKRAIIATHFEGRHADGGWRFEDVQALAKVIVGLERGQTVRMRLGLRWLPECHPSQRSASECLAELQDLLSPEMDGFDVEAWMKEIRG